MRPWPGRLVGLARGPPRICARERRSARGRAAKERAWQLQLRLRPFRFACSEHARPLRHPPAHNLPLLARACAGAASFLSASDARSRDDYFMAIAFLSAQRSKDPKKQVGACIVNSERVIVGIGYNGFPRGCAVRTRTLPPQPQS